MNRHFWKRLTATACALALSLTLLPVAQAANTPASSSNINRQDYTTYGSTVKSHLYENEDGGLTRVEYINGTIVAEDYDSGFSLQSSRTVPMELSIWGGFYAGESYNFLIFGQNNPGESDSTEVIRVVKYSKDWQRLGQASLRGANTIEPFSAGSLRCDEYGGYLYIRTCHKMYKSSDGLNHQANLTMAVDESSMTITDSYYDVFNSTYGYVSHSFNQFIMVDQDGYIVALDHGDAYPRGVVHTRYYSKAGTGRFTGQTYARWCSCGSIKDFAGAAGNNTTGASIGGLAETGDYYIMAYNYDNAGGTGGRYPYCHFMDKATGTSWSVQLSQTAGCTTPVLAPMGLSGGYMLWNGKSGYTANDTLYYIAYGADGKPGQIQNAAAPLSDCQPIAYNGKAVWYVTDNSTPTFYTLDGSGVKSYTASGQSGQEPPEVPEAPVTPEVPETPAKPSTPAAPSGSLKVDTMLAAPTFSLCTAVKADGSLYGWGDGRTNMGVADTHPSGGLAYQSTPAKIGSGYIASGCCWGVKADHSLWIWGLDIYVTGNPYVSSDDVTYLNTPVKVMDDVAYASLEETRGLALKTDGTLWGWGLKDELTTASTPNGREVIPATAAIKLMDNVKQFGNYYRGWYALKTDGTLYQYVWTEGLTKVMDGVTAFSGDGNGNTFLAIKADGSLYGWGQNTFCQLGIGDNSVSSGGIQSYHDTVKIMDNVVYACSDGNQSYAITADGTLYGWGENSQQQLGFQGGTYTTGKEIYETAPTVCQATPVRLMDNALAVIDGYVLKQDGSLWTTYTDSGRMTGKYYTSFHKILDGVKLPGSADTAATPSKPSTPSTPSASSKPAAPDSPSAPSEAKNPFTDVPENSYYHDAVLWALEKGITTGVTATQFQPNAACTRGQVVTFLWRAKGCPEPVTKVNPFTDVSASGPFYKAILWAYENNITTGTTATTFNPGGTCTSAHVVTFLWRANGKPAASGTSALASTYPGGYYSSAVAWADSSGLLSGTGKTFMPGAMSPRADIVTYLYRDLAA